MPDTLTFTRNQLIDFLDEFTEWYESQWLSDFVEIEDMGMDCPTYYLWLKQKDPLWPDRPPRVT